VRIAERVLNTVFFAAVLDAAALDLTVLCATGLDEAVLWVVAFDAAAFAVLDFVALDVLGAGFACEKATRCSGTLNIASTRQAVMQVLR